MTTKPFLTPKPYTAEWKQCVGWARFVGVHLTCRRVPFDHPIKVWTATTPKGTVTNAGSKYGACYRALRMMEKGK